MKSTVLIAATVLMLVVIGVVLWVTGVFGGGSVGSAGFGGNVAETQAVFLTNGQVYFGSFSQSAGVARLENIYYLQVDQQSQLGTDPSSSAQEPDVKLIKLGNELHGPKDVMRINPAQILFVEDLKEDGKVAEAIQRYEREGPDADTGTTGQSTSGSDSSSSTTIPKP
ncbi:MAG: hypothetical protein AAB701_00830 [Patescibacteria group bacterium]